MEFEICGLKATAFRSSTAWEGQIGPYWASLSYPRFWWTTPIQDIFHFGKEMV